MRPSFLAHAFNGLTLFIALILFGINYKQFDIQSLIKILLLISIATGIHGLTHHYEEIYYDFNPLVGKWNIRDNKL